MNRFKGLDLVNRGLEELWIEVHDIVQKAVNKIIPKEKKSKRQKRKGKVHPTKCRVPENSKERQEGLLR